MSIICNTQCYTSHGGPCGVEGPWPKKKVKTAHINQEQIVQYLKLWLIVLKYITGGFTQI